VTTTQEYTKPSDPCADCDTGDIDELACKAKGIQRRAEVMTEFLANLQTFKTQFESARSDYTKARDSSQADVNAATTQLKSIIEQLKCLLDDDKRECLSEAFDKVVDAIRECAGEPGCCAGPCDFDHSVEHDESIGHLAGRIEHYRRETKKAMDCFTSLIAEQAELPARATKYKAEVAQIGTDIGAEGGTAGAKAVRLLARAYVADYHLKGVWNGFPSINSYVDCLCGALVCSHRGAEAIARLEGAKATKECHEAAAAAACKRKQEQTVDEVMAEYVKCRAKQTQPTSERPGQAS
jgi:hypothetical protein